MMNIAATLLEHGDERRTKKNVVIVGLKWSVGCKIEEVART